MSDIRFNQWLHQSGTGGVSQVASGAVGVGTTNPLADFYVRGDAQITGILTAGHIAMGSSITFGDDDRAYFGDGTDLQIYHSGSHSFIQDTGTGNLFIDSNSVQIRNAAASKTTAKFIENAQVELYYNNTERIRTTNTGALVTGILTATSFVGDGSNLTGITQTTISGNANNRIITGSGTANTLNGESTFTYDGDGLLSMTSTSGSAEFTIVGPNNTDSGIYFNDGANDGAISYDHSVRQLKFRAGGHTRMYFAGGNDNNNNVVYLANNSYDDGILQYYNGGLYFKTGSSNGDRLISFHTAGNQRLIIDSSGRVLIGTTTEGHASADDLTINNSGHGGITIRTGTTSNGAIFFSDATSGAAEYDGYVQYNHGSSPFMQFGIAQSARLYMLHDGTISYRTGGGKGYSFNSSGSSADLANVFCPASYTLAFGTNSNERVRIDSSGRLIVGHDTALQKFHGPYGTNKRNPQIQINGQNVQQASISLTSWDNNVVGYYGPAIFLAKSGSSTIGTNSRVSNQNSILGSIIFSGDDGDEFIKGAMIQAAVDNVDGAQTGGNDMPGRLQFLTTQDGAQEPTERLRILSNGRIKFVEDPIQRNSGSVDSFSGDGAYMQHYVSRNGSTYRRNLDIAAVGDGTWGCSIRFSTNPDSSVTSLERMRIDHRGIVTKPYHPSFCARHNNGDGFSGDIIVLTRMGNPSWDVWNIGGHYSTSTGKFTAPVTGVYYFEGQLMTTGHGNGDNIQDMLQLYSNRGRISYCRQRKSYFRSDEDANGYYTNSVGGSARLDAGDTVWLQRQSGHSWSYSNRYYSYFTGWLIG